MIKNKELFLQLYNSDNYTPKISLYKLYFIQNRKIFPKKLITTTFSSYMGGVVFGGMMLGITLLNNFGMGGLDFMGDVTELESSYKFKNMQEFYDSCRYQLKSLHQNGMFVIRYSLFMGLVNKIATHLPILNSNFGGLYGYKNMKFISYFGVPLFIMLGFNRTPIYKRMGYAAVLPVTYYLYKKAKNKVKTYI